MRVYTHIHTHINTHVYLSACMLMYVTAQTSIAPITELISLKCINITGIFTQNVYHIVKLTLTSFEILIPV